MHWMNGEDVNLVTCTQVRTTCLSGVIECMRRTREKIEATQTEEGQTDLLGNATNVFPHEDCRGERRREG